MLPYYTLWLIVGIEGFVSLAAQMLAIRQLMPFVGNTVTVTSLIIGIFLLALAMGYWQGGHIAQRKGIAKLIRNFILAGTWLGLGLSYVFLECWFLLGQQVLTGNLYILLVLYLLIIVALPVYWLGQTVPIVMNLWESEQRAGVIGGRVLQLSTLGSFLGAVFTSVILMNFLGLGWTVFITSALLFFLAWILAVKRENSFRVTIGLLLLTVCFYWLNVIGSARYFVATNNYAQYHIFNSVQVDGKPGKLLSINNSSSSFIAADGTAFRYIEMIKKIVFKDLEVKNQAILVLGAGGFTFSAQEIFGNSILYVDIDPKIKEIVEKHYLSDIKGNFLGADARVFAQQTTERFAVVIADAYSNKLSIPAHLVTVEFFNAVNSVLLPQGTAIFNMIIDPLLDDPYSIAMDTGLRAVFKDCVSFAKEYGDYAMNVIYVCKRNDKVDMRAILSKSGAPYYTDDRNRSTWDQQFLKITK